ncbi:MAG: AAA family ATPase [Syntrophales bacterium]|nr:AAA family ATPase [Syntrophales bacterium]
MTLDPETIRQALQCGQPGCTCGQPRGNVHCPAHDDKTPSLSISQSNGRVLVKCFGGCSQAAVIDALQARDLWPSTNGDRARTPKPRIVATYDYLDAAGKLVFQVVRREPKDFLQRRPDGKGSWIWNLEGVPRVPYRLPELLKADTVFVVEGEKDVHSLEALGLTATCNPGGAGKWRKEYNQYFKGKQVVILPDNDPPDKNFPEGAGRAHAQDVARHLQGVAASIKMIELPGLPDKGDVSDWTGRCERFPIASTRQALFAMVKTAPEWQPQARSSGPKVPAVQEVRRQEKPNYPHIDLVTGSELQNMEFKDPTWIVPGILPEGLCLLSARPKKGKTWWAANVAVATATGGCALSKTDLRVAQGKVLYLCLEDKLRRMQKRLKTIIGDAPFPEDLILADSWPRLDKGGLEALNEFLKEHSDCKLVVVDSFAKIKPPRPKNQDMYEFDMTVGGTLQALAQERQVCILLIYHNRKAEAEDPLDEVIGGTGLTGAVDAVLILRRGRGKADGTLFITGRDVEEQELALKFHPGEGLWELMGSAAECAISQERKDILLILSEVGPKTPAQLAKIIGKKYDAIRMNLARMKDAGLVRLRENGEYQIA